MPIDQFKKKDAISKTKFHTLLRAWLDDSDEAVVAPDKLGPTAVIHVYDDDRFFILHADTSRRAVTWYLHEAVGRYGDAIEWTVVPNNRGRMTAVAYGPEQLRNTAFYLYLHPSHVAKAPKENLSRSALTAPQGLGDPDRKNTTGPIEKPSVHPAERPARCVPPIAGIEPHLDRIEASRGTSERNIEDVVREFFTLIGHRTQDIEFQRGRIDICIHTSGEPIVVEVKRTLQPRGSVQAARRQAFDYANQVNASLVVITDADRYHVFDRRLGGTYDDMAVGFFELTRWLPDHQTALDAISLHLPSEPPSPESNQA